MLTRIPEDSLARANRFPPIFLPESRHDAILRRCFRTIVDHKRWRAARRGPVERGWKERGEKKEKIYLKHSAPSLVFYRPCCYSRSRQLFAPFSTFSFIPCAHAGEHIRCFFLLSLSIYIIKAVSMVSANYRRIKRRN